MCGHQMRCCGRKGANTKSVLPLRFPLFTGWPFCNRQWVFSRGNRKLALVKTTKVAVFFLVSVESLWRAEPLSYVIHAFFLLDRSVAIYFEATETTMFLDLLQTVM